MDSERKESREVYGTGGVGDRGGEEAWGAKGARSLALRARDARSEPSTAPPPPPPHRKLLSYGHTSNFIGRSKGKFLRTLSTDWTQDGLNFDLQMRTADTILLTDSSLEETSNCTNGLPTRC